MKDNNILELKKISKSFKDKNVFSELSFEVAEFEKVMVYGPNGVGKTTLLKIMSAQMIASLGSLTLKGKLYSDFEDIRKYIGWLPSYNEGLFERMTGKENIDFFSSLSNQDSSRISSKADEWLCLESFKKAYVTPFYQCSSGMKKIMKIFILTLQEPEVLIWDEPFEYLDDQTKKFLKESYLKRKTLIFSSHSQHEGFVSKKINLEGSLKC